MSITLWRITTQLQIPQESHAMCWTLGSLLFTEAPGQIYQSDSKGSKSPDEDKPTMFTVDDDAPPDTFESQPDPDLPPTLGNSNLLSVDQFLDSLKLIMMPVLETSSQVGRVSISADSDLHYKEMAGHCEALQMGKQQKMSDFMISHIQENVASHSLYELNQAMRVAPYSQCGNPFLDQNFSQHKPSTATPTLCAIEYHHHPDFFRLPAVSSFDNFLKAAGS